MNSYGAQVYTALMGAEAVAASTAYVLVDLSDTTNFPHNDTNVIHLLGLRLVAEKASDGVYDIWAGVITEVDATNGSADWFHVFHVEAVGNATDSTDRVYAVLDFTWGGSNPDGLSLKVNSDESTPHFVTYATQDGNTNWQTDTGLASPAGSGGGSTGKPGVGDLVFWVEEVSGSGTIDFALSADYFTT
jgi:hypothetical protein